MRPASLANVLHSLGRRTGQQAVLTGTAREDWFGVLPGGLTLDQLAEVARARVGPTQTIRNAALAGFRARLHEVNNPGVRYIVNFHRGPLFARGHGHFSPIIAYLPERDMALVGDVNAAYQPFLVNAERLWAATRVLDPATDEPRGLLRIDMRSQTPIIDRSPAQNALTTLEAIPVVDRNHDG